MQKMTAEENKKVQIGILEEFAKFCDENNLRYYLACGTLIGAVRHKGFIPWDDDIDVHMPRADYNKLIATFNNNPPKTYIHACCPYDKDSTHPMVTIKDTRTIKVEKGYDYTKNGYESIGMDVFPLDGVPEDYEEDMKWRKKLKSIYRKYNYNNMSFEGGWKRKVFLIPCKLLFSGKARWLKKAEKLHAMYKYDDCKYIGVCESTINSEKNRYKKEWFDNTVKLKFEGKEFIAPAEFDTILRLRYGDYMQLPPEHMRIPPHAIECYWKEEK